MVACGQHGVAPAFPVFQRLHYATQIFRYFSLRWMFTYYLVTLGRLTFLSRQRQLVEMTEGTLCKNCNFRMIRDRYGPKIPVLKRFQ